ncbi:Putative aliphatic sulfonates transport permease protein SsuC [Clostridium felsineum]|uniref:Aliphatic sulfonates transport permease protein SsuC n=1 Tax=Clostridium felsineum TaxID=36839 RepID=A0A1S8L3M4_9CLOT|nr:Putative aliphatic sulfonates transport permease protein SsuC [Clostridium felsineum]URZ08997.1 Putative aliphatic sulfonates transport permease protein SsuC [Clostridium felsineum]URZ09625.1 Putative aliphatic sulfonates transport permease protein SsuC [Clostridium felsineum]URZ14033.1 Putative aliphatic sulfonates transport permease protein SsuC [Clostridium felsineum DSM 794]
MRRVLFYIILIAIWELTYKVFVDVLGVWKSYTFPSPGEVINVFVYLINDNTLFIAIGTSIIRLIIGYLIALFIGIILALICIKYKYIDENLTPLMLGLQTLPSVCWIPFAILWYGIDERSIIFVTVVGSVFSIAIATISGVKNINPIYAKAARTMGAKGKILYFNVIIPSALPEIISGMRQGWSFAWRALMAGEMLSATKGLGQVLMAGRELGDISQVMAVMIVIIVFGLVFDKLLFAKLERNIRYRCGLEKKN